MRLASIVGARPQFIKLAPVVRAFERLNAHGDEPIEHIIIHTGQHYDSGLSGVFFDELQIPCAAVNLGVGSGPHGSQTGMMLAKIEHVWLDTPPDLVVIYGDTNSTVAGALAAAKLQIPVAHVEAGVRSFNRRMPEEINRVVADHISDLLLAPTQTAMDNLEREGLSERAVLTGDVMYDAVRFNHELAVRQSTILERLGLTPRRYGLVTVHRAENTDDRTRLGKVLAALNDLAASGLRLVFPIHPRTAKLVSHTFPGWSPNPGLHLMEPVGYLDMLCLVSHARMTLTDSGGLQKDAFFLGCPCITLRDETEWVETVQAGGNTLAGVDPVRIRDAVSMWERRLSTGEALFSASLAGPFGDGRASDKIRDALLGFSRFHMPMPAASMV